MNVGLLELVFIVGLLVLVGYGFGRYDRRREVLRKEKRKRKAVWAPLTPRLTHEAAMQDETLRGHIETGRTFGAVVRYCALTGVGVRRAHQAIKENDPS